MASPPPAPPADRGIDLTTLLLSAIASAVAAYVTSKIWAPGTLFSAAMSPVIVALVKEGLRKPTEVVANVVPTVVPVSDAVVAVERERARTRRRRVARA